MLSRRTLLSSLAGAAAAGRPKVYLFNIPAQPLRAALIAYAAVVGTQILYDARTAQGRRSHAVVGLFSAETALRLLISGTDLTILASGGDSVLVPVSDLRNRAGEAGGGTTLVLDTLYVDVPPGSEQRRDYADYGQRVRAQLLHAITSDPRTAKRIYTLRLGITIAANGAVGIARLTRAEGTAGVIDALQRVIRGIVLDRPPAGMPQPIYLTIIGV